jgi:hypothetical protein
VAFANDAIVSHCRYSVFRWWALVKEFWYANLVVLLASPIMRHGMAAPVSADRTAWGDIVRNSKPCSIGRAITGL